MKKQFKPSTYYSLPKNIKVHNNFLEILEDCINESTLTSEQKQETSTVLYKYFCDDSVNKGDKIIKPKFKPRFIMEGRFEEIKECH